MIPGHFHLGSPAIDVSIQGVNPKVTKTFKALIDTGFTGYAQIPLVQAFGLALVLESISPFTLADGSKSYSLLCWGKVKTGGIETDGLISLSHGGDIFLLGTRWLTAMNMELRVDCKSQKVSLVPILPSLAPVQTPTPPDPTQAPTQTP